MGLRWDLVGVVLLVASGMAWVVNGIRIERWMEVLNCAVITLSYVALAFAAFRAQRQLPWAIVGAAAAASVWLLLDPIPPLTDVSMLLWLLAVGGLVAAALAVRAASPMLGRAGFAANALVALYTVTQADLPGFNGWTIGNVLGLAGFVALALDGVAREPPLTG